MLLLSVRLYFFSLFVWPSVAWAPGDLPFVPYLPSKPIITSSSSVRYPTTRIHHATSTRLGSSSAGAEDVVGLNELHTLLRDAVKEEDYVEAGRISNVVLTRLYGDDSSMSDEEKRIRRRKMSWRGLGAAPWLTERLDALNFTFPTTIQINSMEAVNCILDDSSNSTEEMVESTSLEERVDMNDKDMGIVISGTTGSGKTLAYLVPLLSTLSDSLFKRQRIRVGAEEMVGDTTGDVSSIGRAYYCLARNATILGP